MTLERLIGLLKATAGIEEKDMLSVRFFDDESGEIVTSSGEKIWAWGRFEDMEENFAAYVQDKFIPSKESE